LDTTGMIRSGKTLTKHRNIVRISVLCKADTGERAWKAIGDIRVLQSRVDHDRKIKSRKQRRDIGKYSSVNRTIQLWNQLPADALGTLSCKQDHTAVEPTACRGFRDSLL
jgi:hypothetical protein